MGAFGVGGMNGDVPGGGFPFGGAAQLAFNLIPSLEAQFSGAPRGAATESAIARLLDAQAPPAIKEILRQYGLGLYKLFQSGTVTSTSTGPGRAALDRLFAHTVSALEAQGYTRKDALALASGMITSHQTFLPGTVLGEIVPQPTGQPAFATRPSPVLELQPNVPPVFPSSGSQNFADQFLTLGKDALKELTHAQVAENLIQDITGQKVDLFKAPPVNPFQSFSGYREELSKLINPQPSVPVSNLRISPQPGGQPEIIDPRDCPSCNPQQSELQRELRGQQGQLQHELTVEQQQEGQQQLQQQQQQIQHFSELEQRPPSERDIPREIQQKMALLEQIGQELGQLQQQIDNPTSGGRPVLTIPQQPPPSGNSPQPGGGQPGQPQTFGQPAPTQGELTEHEHEAEEQQIFIQKQPTGAGGDPNAAVKFCVACVTQSDALKFLNGEPSACSVIPD